MAKATVSSAARSGRAEAEPSNATTVKSMWGHQRSEGDATRHETPLERLDRNLEELTGELRVIVTGVQVLFAFLLIVPFNTGFAHVGRFEQTVYIVTLILAALAAVCTIAPSAQHRFLFRHDDKRYLVFSLQSRGNCRSGVPRVGDVRMPAARHDEAVRRVGRRSHRRSRSAPVRDPVVRDSAQTPSDAQRTPAPPRAPLALTAPARAVRTVSRSAS